jgi:hypothetical protein
MIRRTDGKWWSDKAPQARFDTLELVQEFEEHSTIEEPKAVPKVVESLAPKPVGRRR